MSRESDDGAIFWPNPHPLRSCPFSKFFGCFFDFLPLNLLLVWSRQAEMIIIVKRLIQERNKVSDEDGSLGVEPRSRDRDHTVAVKTAL